MANENVLIAPLNADEYKHLIEKMSNYPTNKPLKAAPCSSLRVGFYGAENVEIKIVETDELYVEVQTAES
jgi:hypothetical protein